MKWRNYLHGTEFKDHSEHFSFRNDPVKRFGCRMLTFGASISGLLMERKVQIHGLQLCAPGLQFCAHVSKVQIRRLQLCAPERKFIIHGLQICAPLFFE